MNNNTTLYDGMSDENALIKDIEAWEDSQFEFHYDARKVVEETFKAMDQARRLLTRAKELL